MRAEGKFIAVVDINYDIDLREVLSSYVSTDNLNVYIEETLTNQLHELLVKDMGEDGTASVTPLYSNVTIKKR